MTKKVNEPEQQAIVRVNGNEVWSGAWWKIWQQARVLVADNRGKAVKIEIEMI